MSIQELSLDNLIKLAIETELSMAREKHGKYFATHKDAWGELLEEVQETEKELNKINSKVDYIWDLLKEDAYGGVDLKLEQMAPVAHNLILEAIQVAAMIQKYKETNDIFNGVAK